MRFLDEQYLKTPFYGIERLLPLLVAQGSSLNRKRLRRLMGVVGWQTLYTSVRTMIPGKNKQRYPYLMKGLEIEPVNQVWAIDITYMPMAKGFIMKRGFIRVWDTVHRQKYFQSGRGKRPRERALFFAHVAKA